MYKSYNVHKSNYIKQNKKKIKPIYKSYNVYTIYIYSRSLNGTVTKKSLFNYIGQAKGGKYSLSAKKR